MSETNLIPAVLDLAAARIGWRETPRGSNRGLEIDMVNRRAHAPLGSPWCASFVVDCIAQTALTEGAICPIPLTASCDVLLEWARRRNRLFGSAQPGDLFLVMASEHDAVHTGLVEAVHTDAGTLTTIEGNSNGTGGREGFQSLRRTRGMRALRFARWQDEPNAAMPAEDATSLVQPPAPVPAATKPWTLYLAGSFPASPLNMGEVPVMLGAAQVPIRRLTRALGLADSRLTFDPTAQGVAFDGKLLPAQITLIKGEAYGAARKVAPVFGLSVTADIPARTVLLHRPAV